MALSMQLHTGVDYFMEMPVDDLNAMAEDVRKMLEEVSNHGKKQ